jgi:hypothetical protein
MSAAAYLTDTNARVCVSFADLIDHDNGIRYSLTQNDTNVSPTGENYGSRTASKVLNDLCLYSGGMITAKIVLNAPFNEMDGIKNKISITSKKSVGRLVHDIMRRGKHPLQRIKHAIVFGMGIKPFVMRKGDKYEGVIRKWQTERL